LVYDSVDGFIHKGSDAIKTESQIVEIHCDKLLRIDSAGVAVLISWQRYCEQNNQQLQLTNLPRQAVSLIKANKLDGFFCSSS
jgi:ABC-type transporter Mla MlaB component